MEALGEGYDRFYFSIPHRDFRVALALVITAVLVSRRRRTALIGVVYAIGEYLLWPKENPWLPATPDLWRHFTFFFLHFPGSRVWHPVIL